MARLALRAGSEGLVEVALDPEVETVVRKIAISTLRQYHHDAALAGLCKIALLWTPIPVNVEERLLDAVCGALNFRLMSPRGQILGADAEAAIRNFATARVRSPIEGAASTAMCVLRFVGDQSSLDVVRERGRLAEPWEGVPALAVRAIKARLKRSAT